MRLRPSPLATAAQPQQPANVIVTCMLAGVIASHVVVTASLLIQNSVAPRATVGNATNRG